MENHNEPHIVPFKTYGIILAVLVVLTLISVAVTQIDLASLTVFTAILLATIKSGLVLVYFMHLKFDNKLLKALVSAVFILIALVMFVTFLDYNYR
ncbi:cytochrome C oxidase subunit IV family protein [Carboxylicivirga linearis]|uniref:Cytochrome C oxidase subunit IV family protein n=1 Tax=Carboxylicivirga linearis TaxID=1628157 RepID=A0ABS5JPS6_9BACT|nr:cytochrome C oxidase subunit IV family protein [Carboxylicivirga linearis]MBS2096891.1 cytochrome C oxidase subunit IV family protein [Carboxylicivirga linearis]